MKKKFNLSLTTRIKPQLNKIKQDKVSLISLGIIFLLVIVGFLMTDYTNEISNFNSPLNHTNTPNKYTITVIDNSAGGNITNNTALMQYMPKTELSNKIIATAQNGTTMVTFGDGSEPHVMIVAGVHGAELPTQIAAMNLINDLVTTKIKGTIYIIPFAVPCDTAANTRLYHGKNPNIITRTPGSPTNLIIQTALKDNVTYLGDFHSSQPHDVPGKNCVLYYNNKTSYDLANYMAKNSNVPLISAMPYPGLLTTVSTNEKITSIVSEVLSPHGKVKPGSSEISYKNMISFLQYTGTLI